MEDSDSDSGDLGGCRPPTRGGALNVLHFVQTDVLTGGIIRFVEIFRRVPRAQVTLITDEGTKRNDKIVRYLAKLPRAKAMLVKSAGLCCALKYLSFALSAAYLSIKCRRYVDLVHTDEPLRFVVAGFVAYLMSRKPWVCTFQGLWCSSRQRLIFYARTLLLRFATAVVVPSKPVKLLLSSCGVNPRKIIVIEGGVDPRLFKPMPADKAFDCLYVGRISGDKGIDLLLDAWSIVVKERPHAKLGIVGDGGKLPALPNWLRGSVTFHGWVDYEQVPKLLNRARIFLCPSKSETFCQSLAEALACGLPAIANGLPVFKQLWGDLVVYAEPDPREWADAILRLVNYGDGGEAGCAKRRSAACRYTWDRAARLMHSLLRGLEK